MGFRVSALLKGSWDLATVRGSLKGSVLKGLYGGLGCLKDLVTRGVNKVTILISTYNPN